MRSIICRHRFHPGTRRYGHLIRICWGYVSLKVRQVMVVPHQRRARSRCCWNTSAISSIRCFIRRSKGKSEHQRRRTRVSISIPMILRQPTLRHRSHRVRLRSRKRNGLCGDISGRRPESERCYWKRTLAKGNNSSAAPTNAPAAASNPGAKLPLLSSILAVTTGPSICPTP